MGRVMKFAAQRMKTQSAVSLPKHPTVLIADDNEGLREILMHHLSRQGYRVRTARDGKAALATLAKEEIHVLLLDLQLPELDGFTVLRHVRDERRGPFPYVIVMSGRTSERDKEKAIALAADDYLAKPFFLAHLSARLRAFASHYRQEEL
jgi:DNA-binding response OmpR family regulator